MLQGWFDPIPIPARMEIPKDSSPASSVASQNSALHPGGLGIEDWEFLEFSPQQLILGIPWSQDGNGEEKGAPPSGIHG